MKHTHVIISNLIFLFLLASYSCNTALGMHLQPQTHVSILVLETSEWTKKGYAELMTDALGLFTQEAQEHNIKVEVVPLVLPCSSLLSLDATRIMELADSVHKEMFGREAAGHVVQVIATDDSIELCHIVSHLRAVYLKSSDYQHERAGILRGVIQHSFEKIKDGKLQPQEISNTRSLSDLTHKLLMQSQLDDSLLASRIARRLRGFDFIEESFAALPVDNVISDRSQTTMMHFFGVSRNSLGVSFDSARTSMQCYCMTASLASCLPFFYRQACARRSIKAALAFMFRFGLIAAQKNRGN